MTTAAQARQAIRSRIETAGLTNGAGGPLPVRWPNEPQDSLGNTDLPSPPAPFVYVEVNNTGSANGPAGYGGGSGQNIWRNRGRIEAYVFVPKDDGLDRAEGVAEQIASLFRSYRDEAISCFAANVMPGGDGAMLTPPGLVSEVGNYFWAMCTVRFHFDQVG